MQWLQLDPDLPTLSAAFDGNALAQRFAQQWPAQRATSSPWTVTPGRRQDVHYQPGQRCTATYPLRIEGAGQQTIGLVEATPAGVTHRLYTEDAHMPGLARVAAGGTIAGAAVTPVRYKPGARCTFRCELPSAKGVQIRFGKCLAHGAAHLWRTVSTLYARSLQETELPRIAQPLAYDAQLGLVVQAAAPGSELHTVAFDEHWLQGDRIHWLRAAGRSIAALHNASGITAPVRTLVDDLTDLAAYGPALRKINPALADGWAAASATLAAFSQAQSAQSPVLSHGALRTDQFLVVTDEASKGADVRPALIDLDGLCWADPARDLGNLLAYLTWKRLRQTQHAELIPQLQQAFLDGYAQLRPLPEAEWLARYQAASLLKIIGRRYSGLTYQEWPLTAPLLDIASAVDRLIHRVCRFYGV